jgi:hypothetical protein
MSLCDDPVLARTHAGLLAASNAVVSKLPGHRPPPIASHAPGFRPASLAEVPRLVAGAEPIHRAAAAALCHAYETQADGRILSGGLAERIWRNGALKTYSPDSSLLDVGGRSLTSSRSRDLFAHLVDSSVAVVNPDVQIEAEFGQDGSNISSASIKNYQLLLPETSAVQVLGRSHPLNWQQAAPDLFKSVVPAVSRGTKPRQRWERDPRWVQNPNLSTHEWEVKDGVGYIYETAIWPWSESVTLGVENVLRISGFKSSSDGREKKELTYKYTLERCMRSDYGVIVEELSGLDIDEGEVEAEAVPFTDYLSKNDVPTLRVADLRRLAKCGRRETEIAPEELTKIVPDDVDTTRKKELLSTIAQQASEKLWLVTISSSKRLRYTVPQYAPIDLWASLTWIAPALLYHFIDTAVCQLPQFVEKEIKTGKTLTLIKGTAP